MSGSESRVAGMVTTDVILKFQVRLQRPYPPLAVEYVNVAIIITFEGNCLGGKFLSSCFVRLLAVNLTLFT